MPIMEAAAVEFSRCQAFRSSVEERDTFLLWYQGTVGMAMIVVAHDRRTFQQEADLRFELNELGRLRWFGLVEKPAISLETQT